jgi:RTX calcium-binding nonapeptide repeat (4 copies)
MLALSVLFVCAGIAGAATIRGTGAADTLRGTAGPDNIFAGGGSDRVFALPGNDFVIAGAGADAVFAGPGADRIATQADGAGDKSVCGGGRDLVNLDTGDTVAKDCEVVARRVSRLRTGAYGQVGTEVEPDSFTFGTKTVTAFQLGRYVDGGAAAIGWATSVRGGAAWRAGKLPGLSSTTPTVRFSDPVVAYDAAHRQWLIASLRGPEDAEIVISRSRTGLAWTRPLVADGPDLDKEWLVCDNWATSPFRGRCYLSYLNGESGAIETRLSADGGRTWSAPASAPPSPLAPGQRTGAVNGAFPLVRPDGTLIVAYTSFKPRRPDELLAIRSTDGGATFAAPALVTPILDSDVQRDIAGNYVRTAPLPSGDVDAGGRVYLAFHDCRDGAVCGGTQVVLVTSADGIDWDDPTVVPTTRAVRGDAIIPALSVLPGTRAGQARVAITYYFRPECVGVPTAQCPGVDAELVESQDGGATWRRPQRLNAQPMPLGWIANTDSGRMLGDYISTSWVRGRPLAVFSLASEPRRPAFRQSTFAARVPR